MGYPSFSPIEPRRSPTRGSIEGTASAAGGESLQKSAQNLLAHIPGEASGFYLLAADNIQNPGTGTLVIVFVMALVLLLVVRVVGKASPAVIATSIGALVVWMFVLDKGVFNVLLPGLIPDPLGLLVAVFYSTIITILANAGIIK